MASEKSIQVAGSCWCDPRTETIQMDVRLAEVFAEKIDQYIEAIIWMGGATDFRPEGMAHEGWLKIRDGLLR